MNGTEAVSMMFYKFCSHLAESIKLKGVRLLMIIKRDLSGASMIFINVHCSQGENATFSYKQGNMSCFCCITH